MDKKVIFFRHLTIDDLTSEWSSSQQIVYSFLLAQSILETTDFFEKDGVGLDLSDLYLFGNGYIELAEYNTKPTYELLNLPKQTFYDCIAFLKNNKIIKDGFIYFSSEIIKHGYFVLRTDLKGLTKRNLIFYSWLWERGQKYGNTLDTYSYRIAQLTGVNESNVRVILHRLKELGYIERIKVRGKKYGAIKLLK